MRDIFGVRVQPSLRGVQRAGGLGVSSYRVCLPGTIVSRLLVVRTVRTAQMLAVGLTAFTQLARIQRMGMTRGLLIALLRRKVLS